jgi:hypothetical protein
MDRIRYWDLRWGRNQGETFRSSIHIILLVDYTIFFDRASTYTGNFESICFLGVDKYTINHTAVPRELHCTAVQCSSLRTWTVMANTCISKEA